MKSTKLLEILKLEGNWNQKVVSCCIESNQKLLLVSGLSSLGIDRKEADITDYDLIEIRVKDSLRSDIVGINVPTSLLHDYDIWLPLFPSNSIKTINEIPSKVGLPRILIRINEKILGKSAEINSFSFLEVHGETNESFGSDIELATLIESSNSNNEDTEKTDIQLKFKKQAVITKMLSKQLNSAKDELTQYQKKIEILELKLSKTNEQMSLNISKANEREKNLLETIQSKDLEINRMTSSNFSLQNKLRVLENEKEHHQEQTARLELEIERLKEAEKDLELANQKLVKSENIQEQLNKTIIKLSSTFTENEDETVRSQLLNKDQEISMLKNISEEIKNSYDMQISSLNKEIENLNLLLKVSQEQEKYLGTKLANVESEKVTSETKGNLSIIDNYFLQTMKKIGLSGSYNKLKDFTYQVKGKVVCVALCRGGLFARIGSGLVNLEEFLEDLQEKVESRVRTDTSFSSRTERSIENKPEKTTMTRFPSQKTFLKSTQSSLLKVRPTTPLREKNRCFSRKPFK